MPYTLLKFLLWAILLGVVGGVIGWLLRSLTGRSRAAGTRETATDEDVARMRARLADLDIIVAERDRLRMQVAEMRASDSPGIVGAPPDDEPPPEVADRLDDPDDDGPHEPEPDVENQIDDPIDDGSDEAQPDTAPPDEPSDEPVDGGSHDASDRSSGAHTADHDTADQDTADQHTADQDTADQDTKGQHTAGQEAPDTGTVDDEAVVERAPTTDAGGVRPLDLRAARAVLGTPIQLDDLTVVEGIGPKISELCRGIGVTTWRELADTSLTDLRSMLDAAGSRYQIHDPADWPRQAELLADGRWEEFAALGEDLRGGG